MDTLPKQFGLLIAYLLPGFVVLLGLEPVVPMLAEWFRPVNHADLGFGPPIYAVMAATTLGMAVSSIRWLVIDHLHGWMGVKTPPIDFAAMDGRLQEFSYIVEGTYRFYQHSANMLVAVALAYGTNRLLRTSPLLGPGTDLGVFILCAIFFAASRDSLVRYYVRAGRLLGYIAEKVGDPMTNGFHHPGGGGTESKPSPEPKPQAKTDTPAKPGEPKALGNKPSK